MTMTTGLRTVLMFVILAGLGCSQGSGENKGKAKSGDKAQDAGGGQVQVFTPRPAKAQMDVRPDWKNVPQDEGPRPVVNNDPKSFDGTIKAVDADRRMITISVSGQDYTLRVEPNANIEESSLRSYALQGGLSALQPGNQVLVFTTKQDDQDVVGRIKLKAANQAP
jgi:hypothetical protein